MTLAIYIIAFIGFFFAILNALPSIAEYPLPDGFVDGFETVLGYAYEFDLIIPVDSIVVLLQAAFAFWAIIILWRMIKFTIRIVGNLS